MKNHLFEQKILNGLPKILDNAEALLTDANLLYKNHRKERAYALYQLSIEEIAKAFILLSSILLEDTSSEEYQKKLMKDIQNHTYKSKRSIAINYFIKDLLIEKNGNSEYEQMVLDSFKEIDSIKEINNKKNYALYTTYINNEFKSPLELISEEDVKEIKGRATNRVIIGNKFMSEMVKHYETIKAQTKDIQTNHMDLIIEESRKIEEIKEKNK